MRLPVNQPLAVALLIAVGALCATDAVARRAPEPVAAPPANGPAADYPIVLGEPFEANGVTYRPADTLNYDQVGYAAAAAGGPGISIAHRTLPVPSYVEVTSLTSGRTILARVEQRGPMAGAEFIALSPGAAAQLGADGRVPVRVRRVNPPEAERALLRAGQTAPLRMDTPAPLVAVLLRKLEPVAASPGVVSPAATAPVTVAVKPVLQAVQAPKHTGPAAAPTAPKPATHRMGRRGVIVQVGAFSTPARATTAAKQVGGEVSPAGKLFRVRIAGFDSPAQAAPALAKAKAAGYSDARIQRAD